MGGSVFRVCRHCLATDSDIQFKVPMNDINNVVYI